MARLQIEINDKLHLEKNHNFDYEKYHITLTQHYPYNYE
jgi:hypothetical protein